MTNRKENNQYDQNGNPTYLDFGKGSYSKRTYNEKGEIIFDEGIGNKTPKNEKENPRHTKSNFEKA